GALLAHAVAQSVASCIGVATGLDYLNDSEEEAWEKVVQETEKELMTIFRDFVGNPFRPSPPLSPAVLIWNDGTVVKLAQAIYDERAFDRLPILADALEEAGCQDQDILGHCRSGGEHVRGCWIVDLLLGKE